MFNNFIYFREKINGINGKTMVAQKLLKDYQQMMKVLCQHLNVDFEEIWEML